MKDILYINIPSSGGLAHYANEMCNALVEEGNIVCQITIGNFSISPGHRKYGLYEIKNRDGNLFFRTLSYIQVVQAAYKIRKTHSYSILFINAYQTFLDLLLIKIINVPSACIQHEIDDRISGRSTFTQRLFYRYLDYIILHRFSGVKHYAIKKYNLNPTRVLEINHGLYRENIFGGNPSSKEDEILMLGAMRVDKAPDILLKAYSGRAENGGLTLNLTGLIKSDLLRKDIQLLYREHPFMKDIQINDKFIDDKDVGLVFSSSRYVVIPNRECRQSGTLRLAIYFNKPVIVSDVGELGEFIRKYNIGLVVPPENISSLRQAMESLSNNDDLFRKFKNNINRLKEDKDLNWQFIVHTLQERIMQIEGY
jgi:glycosyltransferase involved in cell wall biosynthesis